MRCRPTHIAALLLLTLAMVVSGLDARACQADTTTLRSAQRLKRTPVTVANDTLAGTMRVVDLAGDTILFNAADSLRHIAGIELLPDSFDTRSTLGRARVFNPSPTRALWLSALCPGLGQIYNRRYWKLPIVVGAFVGLTYGTAWNQRMLNDYARAYRDAMDDDPGTRSYMNFYPPTTHESDIDIEWLKKALKNKKDYYRRYRDICILSMVGVYLLNLVDAYVDASLAHFDISPDISMRVKPTLLQPANAARLTPTVGLQCAFNF